MKTNLKSPQSFENWSIAIAFFIAVGTCSFLIAQDPYDHFSKVVNGPIFQAKMQGSHMFIAGNFADENFAKIDSDGNYIPLGASQGRGFNKEVSHMHAGPQHIWLGGKFTTYGQSLVGHVAKVDHEGTLDRDFLRNIGTGFDDEVTGLFPIGNGDFVISGYFKNFNGYSADGIAYLYSNGEMNTKFSRNLALSGRVESLTRLSNGDLLLGGDIRNQESNEKYLVRIPASHY